MCALRWSFWSRATMAVPRTAKQAQQPATANPTAAQRAMLDQYCVTCHNQQLKTAGLMLDKADLNDIPGGAATWEKVVMKLRAGMMPPLGRPKPDQAAVDSMVSLLETAPGQGLRGASRARQSLASPAQSHGIRQRHSRSARTLKSTSKSCCRRTTKATASTTLPTS